MRHLPDDLAVLLDGNQVAMVFVAVAVDAVVVGVYLDFVFSTKADEPHRSSLSSTMSCIRAMSRAASY